MGALPLWPLGELPSTFAWVAGEFWQFLIPLFSNHEEISLLFSTHII